MIGWCNCFVRCFPLDKDWCIHIGPEMYGPFTWLSTTSSLDNDHQFNPMVCHLTSCNYQIVTVIIFVIGLHSCHCIFCSMCTKKPFWMCWFHLLYWLFSWVVVVYFGNCWITKKKNQEDDLHVVSSFQKKEEEDRPASSTASSSKGLQ